jgi:hypothetical protein
MHTHTPVIEGRLAAIRGGNKVHGIRSHKPDGQTDLSTPDTAIPERRLGITPVGLIHPLLLLQYESRNYN